MIQLQTSFIPKKTLTIPSPASGVGGRSIHVLTVVALLVFFVVIGLALFVFFYKSHLVRSIVEMDTALVLAKKSFDPEFIAAASKLNARIEGAKQLLSTHRALSPLFDVLEKRTLEDVRFQDFNFSAPRGREITIGMTGQAKSFNAIALQSDVFGTEPAFNNPVFANFNLNEKGDVIFNFKATIDPELLLYRETLLRAPAVEASRETPPDINGTSPDAQSSGENNELFGSDSFDVSEDAL